MKKLYVILISLLVVSVSCHTYRYEEHQSRTTQPGMAGLITNTTADLQVSETRISHTEVFAHDKHENDINVDKAKEYTMAAALFKHNADVMVGPLYEVTTNKENNKVTVTVTGYPATYVNFRKTTSEDSILLLTTTSMYKGETTKAKIVSRTYETTDWEIQKRWQNSINVIYGVIDFDIFQVGIDYSGGWRFNKHFLVGLGVGYKYNFGSGHYLPLYAQFKTYFWGTKRVNLLVGIDQGVGVLLNNYGDQYVFGSHTRGELGVNFRLSPTTDLSLSYNVGTSPTGKKVRLGSTAYLFPEHGLYMGCKLAFTF